ncbi:MAG: 2-oxoacid:ferredoxin oxidoreductase subunit beta [Myxococcota bacterium]
MNSNENKDKQFAPKDFKSALKPIWCPGCGDYGVVNAIYRALADLSIPPHKIAFFSGIGCSSRIPGYTTTYGFNGVHGRAIPMALGAKLANPELTVLVAGGDGDGFSIGGNHIPHAVRRNVDITYIVMDNNIYGLTKGQVSPTTPEGDLTVTTVYGNIERPINPLILLLSYGCGFLAQGASHDIGKLANLIKEGIQFKGFSFINVISPCVTYRGGHKQYDEIRGKTVLLDETGHNPADKEAAYRICERYQQEVAFGVIYKNTESKDYNTLLNEMYERAKAKTKKSFPRNEIYKKFQTS